MEKMIAVLGGDARSAALSRLLVQDGRHVCSWGVPDGAAEAPLERAARADLIILPTPMSREAGYLNCTGLLPLRELWAMLRPAQRIYAGSVRAEDMAEAKRCGLTLQDYYAREELAVRSAVPTAEGAIREAMDSTAFTLHGAPCLILGFGRIGKLLAQRLHGLGAHVTVAARRRSDLAWVDAFGYEPLRIDRLAGALGSFRVVFNTVPACVLDDALLGELPRGCVLIELASRPGFSREAAERLGLRAIAAPGLPGRVAPESAAEAVRDILYQMWEEEA